MESIESALTTAIEDGVPQDELSMVHRAVHEYMTDPMPEHVSEVLDQAIDFEFEETSQAIADLTTETELNNHIEFLDELAAETGRDPEKAKRIVYDKMAEIEEPQYETRQTSFRSRGNTDNDSFDDNELLSLFSTLSKH